MNRQLYPSSFAYLTFPPFLYSPLYLSLSLLCFFIFPYRTALSRVAPRSRSCLEETSSTRFYPAQHTSIYLGYLLDTGRVTTLAINLVDWARIELANLGSRANFGPRSTLHLPPNRFDKRNLRGEIRIKERLVRGR